jgi:hypothetical protein
MTPTNKSEQSYVLSSWQTLGLVKGVSARNFQSDCRSISILITNTEICIHSRVAPQGERKVRLEIDDITYKKLLEFLTGATLAGKFIALSPTPKAAQCPER